MTISAETLRKLGRQEVLDETGDSTILSTLWKDSKVALIFIRHFG